MRTAQTSALSRALLAIVLVLTGIGTAPAQQQLDEKALVGAYELSNAERDRSCTVTLSAARAAAGLAVQWDGKCAPLFPFTRQAVAWRIAPPAAIQFVDATQKALLEVSEVEIGLYEGPLTGEGLMFLQSVASSAGEERRAEQMRGNWAFTRADGTALCRITLSDAAARQDTFALQVSPGCDATITRFGPVAWQLDRGQLVIIPARGTSWRFEESDAQTWRRIPEGRQPILLIRE